MGRNNIKQYSQYLDLKDADSRIKGCGIASLGMLLDDKVTDLDELYRLGLKQGAYLPKIGWRHAGLAELAKSFGFKDSYNIDLTENDFPDALAELKKELEKGPVIVSVFAQYEPGHEEGHLIVLLSLNDDEAEVFDPAAKERNKIHQTIPADKFIKAWKRRFIVVR